MSIILLPSNNIRYRFVNRKMQIIKRISKYYDVYVYDIKEPIKLSESRLKGKNIIKKLYADDDNFSVLYFNNYLFESSNFIVNELVNIIPNLLKTYEYYKLKKPCHILICGNMYLGFIVTKFLSNPLFKRNNSKIVLDVDEYLPFHSYNPSITTRFNKIIYYLMKFLFDQVIKNTSTITTVSKPLYDYIKLLNPKSNIFLLTNGADINLFKPKFNCFENEILTIGYVGTYYHNHGLEMAIKALPNILKKYDCELIYVGSGPGYYSLKQCVKKHGVENNVKFIGPVQYEKIPEYINKMDVCINPVYKNLLSEMSSPRKIFEYFACERPVISTPLVDIKRIFGDLVYYANDPLGIENELVKILNNIDEAKCKARIAREIVIKNHNWDVISNGFLDIFNGENM